MRTIFLLLVCFMLLFASYTGKQPTTFTGSGALPATCYVGETAYKTDTISGQNFYGCTAANTWTLQASTSAVVLYGQIYTDATPGPTLTLTTAGTFYPVISYTAVGNQNGVTGNAANGTITIGTTGVYEVSFSASYTSSNMEIYHMSIFLNGITQKPQVSMESKSANNTDVANLNSMGLLTLNAGDVVDLRASAQNNNRTITTNHVTLIVHQVQ